MFYEICFVFCLVLLANEEFILFAQKLTRKTRKNICKESEHVTERDKNYNVQKRFKEAESIEKAKNDLTL